MLSEQKFERNMVILSDTRTTYYVQGCGLTGLYLPVIQVALISEQTVMQIRLANIAGIWDDGISIKKFVISNTAEFAFGSALKSPYLTRSFHEIFIFTKHESSQIRDWLLNEGHITQLKEEVRIIRIFWQVSEVI